MQRRTVIRGRTICVVALLCTVSFCLASPCAAQESRASEIAAKQSEKAQQLQPYQPNVVEKILLRLEQGRVNPPPITFSFETVYSGGSLTGNVLYLRHYGDRSTWYGRAAYSLRQYKLVEVGTTVPGLGRGRRLTLSTNLGWRDATEVGFWGVGMGTAEDGRANYRFREVYGEARADYLATPWLPLSAGLTFEGYELFSGQGSAPSVEDVYTPATAPGLGDSPNFVHSDIRAAIDTRPPGEYTRKGGEYSLGLHHFADVEDGTYSFSRFEAGAVQHIPVVRETWVLSMRARLRSTIGGDSQVPYFLLPTLGGGGSLRSHSSWRFRDRHAADATLEWRWIPNRAALDMAVFFDAGQVADEVNALRPNRFETAVGVGVRLHARQFMVMRMDVAHGSAGWHLTISNRVPF
jgi:hypothetical protein